MVVAALDECLSGVIGRMKARHLQVLGEKDRARRIDDDVGESGRRQLQLDDDAHVEADSDTQRQLDGEAVDGLTAARDLDGRLVNGSIRFAKNVFD